MSDLASRYIAPRRRVGVVERAQGMAQAEAGPRQILDALPAAIYVTDAKGRITYYNEAAAELWGRRPAVGDDEWCGSWKLFWPDGRAMPHDECPMAVALRERRPVRGAEAIAERPDGTRAPFRPYPTPLFSATGELVGAVNMLVDLTDEQEADDVAQRLAAIVATSEDAIVSKDLNGVITSWNEGAERLFGYRADEVIGQSITLLIPPDHLDEEPVILARLRRGERIQHYETVRRRKDGELIEVSLSVSPVRDRAGQVVGASKIARDITERRRAAEKQQLLVREMDHRIRNLFALISGVITLCARSAKSPQELANGMRERLAALGRAQSLTLLAVRGDESGDAPTTLQALIRAIVSPHVAVDDESERVTVRGVDAPISRGSLSSLALLLHEFATNAAKYGALSTPSGHVDIECAEASDARLEVVWTELGGPPIARAPTVEGFGSLLARMTVVTQLKGDFTREWLADGLQIRLAVPRDRLAV